MELTQALELLKTIVKESAVDGQNHIDLTLTDPAERPKFQQAMAVVKNAVAQGEIEEAKVNKMLSL